MAKKTNRLRGFVFYPAVWLDDVSLRMCSYETKGVWMEFLCYMHQVEMPHLYGTFSSQNGKPLSEKQIRSLTKIDSEVFDRAWAELIEHGVLKKSPTDFYYSKRLVSENKRRQKDMLERNRKVREQIIDYFKDKTGKKLSYDSKSAVSRINARIKEGFAFEDFSRVIDAKCKDWLQDRNMKKYLRPETLFGTKFESYLNECEDILEVKNEEFTKEVIEYLNRRSNRSFTPSSSVSLLVDARIKEGFTLDDFKKVIEVKCNEWLHDSERTKFIRPDTLFGDKFEIYLNQDPSFKLKPKKEDSHSSRHKLWN